MDLRDETLVHDVGLGVTDPVVPRFLGVGPFDLDEGRDSAGPRCRFHHLCSDAGGKKLLHAPDDLVTVAAEQLAFGVSAPRRIVVEE